jgi:3-hydroxyacyl-CoA dehydrogenase/enoyl-CoA hydratase/3-hydroxybutyryl-CoA epimerase/enoyl-CoA isomerase
MYHANALRLTQLESGIGHLVFDLAGSAVNKFNQQTLDELREVLEVVAASDLRGLLCSSAKAGFSAGADIAEFSRLFQLPATDLSASLAQSNALFSRLATLPIPTVSLIDGQALGGGFEFCLATDYRLATRASVLGFPEVGLGICPGFGGTVRAVRVMDLQAAVGWIVSGQTHSADEALAAGAVDALVDPQLLLEAGLEQIEQALQQPDTWQQSRRQRQGALSSDDCAAVFAALKRPLQGVGDPHNPAPAQTLELLERSVAVPAAEALAQERACFVRLAKGEVATSLVGLFVADQQMRQKSRAWAARGQPAARIAVLGAGIMGGGIAYQAALKGIEVQLKDIAQPGLDAGMREAQQLLTKQVQKGRLSQAEAGEALARIHPTLDYSGFAEVDLVVEAVVEKPAVKQAVLAEVERHVPATSILTSNTSTISITALAQPLQRPAQFCGMHFFNPVPLMPLVEVIRGESSSEYSIASTVATAQRLGKTPIVVRDCPGFLVNRILFPYFGAFAMLLRDGADLLAIDAAMEAFGWPMGPGWLLDVVGLDTAVHAQAVMAQGFPERMHYDFKSATQLLFENGRLGQKSGSGFYRYTSDGAGRLQKQIDEQALALISSQQKASRDFTAREIVDRMMLPLCLETVRCLEDGIVDTAAEADMGLVLGLGFPRFRGGALRYLERQGIAAFCALADTHAALGPLYHPTAKLRAMAAAGSRFHA